MLDCISVENMRLSDAQTIAKLVPSLELMRRAADGVFQAVRWEGSVAIMVGSGNNGGDGFALACILHSHQIDCTVFTLSQRLSPDSAFYARKAEETGVSILPFRAGADCLHGYPIIVDCLLGTGFHGQLRDHYKAGIEEINAAEAYVVSVDINSGMNGDTGEADLAVRSDLTVTIGYIKDGLLTKNAAAHMKRLVCADIGIVLVKEENKVCTEEEWETLCQSTESYRIEREGTIYYRCPTWLDTNIIQAHM